MNTVIIGAQYGDEGKAKVVDALAVNYDMIARYQGGANAGHTVVVGDKKYVFHQLPSAALHPGKTVIIGNGCVVDPVALADEVYTMQGLGFDFKLVISGKAHMVRAPHKEADAKDSVIGTTKQGIGPAYADKIARTGLRLRDYFTKFNPNARFLYASEVDEAASMSFLKKYIVDDVGEFIVEQQKLGKTLLAEGAQGTMLDIDHGDYPFVTSSSPTIGGVFTGLGIGPKQIDEVIGIAKPYVTRVGEGDVPFPMTAEEDELLRQMGGEFGATTGRARRCSYLDLKSLKYAARVNGFTSIALTKIDVFADFSRKLAEQGKKTGYMDTKGKFVAIDPIPEIKDSLPREVYALISDIQKEIGVPIKYVSIGAEREKFLRLI